MKSRSCFSRLCLILTFSALPLFGEDWVFTWNLGTFDVAWNQLDNNYDDFTVPAKIGLSFVDLQYSSPDYRLALQFSLFEMKTIYDEYLTGILSPIEVNYNFLASDWAMLGVYGKGGLGFTETRLYPYCEGGFKLGLFMREGSPLKYSWRNSFYIGIDSELDINIGTQFDFGTMGLIYLLSYADELE